MSELRQLYETESARLGHQPDAAQRAAVEKLDDLRSRLISAKKPRNLFKGLLARRPVHDLQRGVYLWGGVGRGKTWLMDLFFQSLPFKDKQRVHFHRFMQGVHEELKRHRDRADPLVLIAQHFGRRTRVLCFDELFVSDIADAMLLGNLFRDLLESGVTLVATSNVPPDGLYKDGLQRAHFIPAIKRLKENMDVLHLDSGTDYRLRLLEHAGTWFAPAGEKANATLDKLFRAVANDTPDAGRVLTINHRKIRTRHRATGAVWFDFTEVCDGPRGQADYIEIARCYHTVLLSDMPVLTAIHENQARRFIALVDEFYDRGVKLFVSAAAPIDHIYTGTQLKFEFERTRSRLTEMQSHEYLALPHRP